MNKMIAIIAAKIKTISNDGKLKYFCGDIN
jgi:hypothetical protein